MRIVGIDPGSIKTGWGVIEQHGPRLRLVDAGVIRMTSTDEFPVRLRGVFEALRDLIDRHKPQAAAIEDMFHAHFAGSALKLAHVRGVILLASSLFDLPIYAYPPTLVKKTVAGAGRADKSQVARIVGGLLGIRTLPPADATDALAVAITHSRGRGLVAATSAARASTSTLATASTTTRR